MELLIKHYEEKYKEYINEHKLNVQKAWVRMKNNSECLKLFEKYFIYPPTDMEVIENLIKHHDDSKYGKEEFDGYRMKYFPISKEEQDSCKDILEKAWVHHYTNNLHHWNWWYLSGNLDAMSLVYVVEMICDWEAMGYKFGNNSLEWYNKEKTNIHLGEKQRAFAEELMGIICK